MRIDIKKMAKDAANTAGDLAKGAAKVTDDAVKKGKSIAKDLKQAVVNAVDKNRDGKIGLDDLIVKKENKYVNDSLFLSMGYEKIDKKTIKELGEKGTWFRKQTDNSFNAINYFICKPESAMNFDDKNGLIDGIHNELQEFQGLICVESGKTIDGFSFIYSIVKTVETGAGVGYFLRMNLLCGKEIFEITGKFVETGLTGMRDSTILPIMMSEKVVEYTDNGLKGWFADPYNPEYTNGTRMNLSEDKKYDEMFPEHPLSQARLFVASIINRDVPVSQNDGKEDSHSKKDKSSTLDDKLNQAINDYNKVYTTFSDAGIQLYSQRVRATDTIHLVEHLINCISNHPKSFDTDLSEINIEKEKFTSANDFAKKELEKAKKEAKKAGSGVVAGAAVASMAPTTAMWIATTFGTASTGTAISAISGAAAQSAALAWLGGGALTTGGLGVAGGKALLGLAGPIGWGIAGFSILTSVILFANNKRKTAKVKQDEIENVLRNSKQLSEDVDTLITLLNETEKHREQLTDQYLSCSNLQNSDYSQLADEKKFNLEHSSTIQNLFQKCWE